MIYNSVLFAKKIVWKDNIMFKILCIYIQCKKKKMYKCYKPTFLHINRVIKSFVKDLYPFLKSWLLSMYSIFDTF